MRTHEDEKVLLLSVGFAEDPRIRELNDSEFRVWVGVLLDQLRNGGGTAELRSYVSPQRLKRYLSIGLLERNDEGTIVIHAWDRWNGRAAWKRFLARERKRRQRERRLEAGDDKWYR